MRLRISVREARETAYWLQFIDTTKFPELERTRDYLVQESKELTKILASIMWKLSGSRKTKTQHERP